MEILEDINVVYFDLETKKKSTQVDGGWKNIHKFGLSCAVTWDKEHGYRHYFEEDVENLVDVLLGADLVVGFNHIDFDYKVVMGYSNKIVPKNMPSFDIMKEFVAKKTHRVKLDTLAEATLGNTKTGDGLKAVEWYQEWQESKEDYLLAKVKNYCEQDVRITKDLFEYACSRQCLLYYRKGDDSKSRLVCDTPDWEEKARATAKQFAGGASCEILRTAVIEVDLSVADHGEGKTSHIQGDEIMGLVDAICAVCEGFKSQNGVDILKVSNYSKKEVYIKDFTITKEEIKEDA